MTVKKSNNSQLIEFEVAALKIIDSEDVKEKNGIETNYYITFGELRDKVV